MRTLTNGFAVLAIACAFCGVDAAERNANTDWMSGKVGCFMHWWPQGTNNLAAQWRDFDVSGLVVQLKEMKADYFFFTMGQNSNAYNAPNATYERRCGYEIGSRCSKRDIPAEIIAALKGTGISFGLYLPCQPSFNDVHAEMVFGNEKAGLHWCGDWYVTEKGAENWAEVIGEWSRRYGAGVQAWWFDGACDYLRFNDAKAERLRVAVLAGNPAAVVSFNCGAEDWNAPEDKKLTLRTWCACSDFTSGEMASPWKFEPKDRWVNGKQVFMLTYLGSFWGKDDMRCSVDKWIDAIGRITRVGGSVCLDLAAGKNGLFNSSQARAFREIVSAACLKSCCDRQSGDRPR